MISKRDIKIILSDQTNGYWVSEELVEHIQKELEAYLESWCNDIVKEHNKNNVMRKHHHLPPLRRIGIPTLLSLLHQTQIYGQNHIVRNNPQEAEEEV